MKSAKIELRYYNAVEAVTLKKQVYDVNRDSSGIIPVLKGPFMGIRQKGRTESDGSGSTKRD